MAMTAEAMNIRLREVVVTVLNLFRPSESGDKPLH
jgi:hypothetical protein